MHALVHADCHCLIGKGVERLDAEVEVSGTAHIVGAMVMLPLLRYLCGLMILMDSCGVLQGSYGQQAAADQTCLPTRSALLVHKHQL